jgi:hypothetical protein
MPCKRDNKMFPGSDVVRVETGQWTQQHDTILEALLDEVRSFLSTRSEMPFDELCREFESNDVRVPVADQYVHILFGPEPMFLRSGKVQTDIKGLVFKPCAHGSKKGNLVVDI